MLRLYLLAWLVVAPFSGVAAGSGLPPEMLQALSDLHRETRTITGDFLQTKRLAMFEHVLISRGSFAIEMPDRIHWSYHEPTAFGFASDGVQVQRWNQHTGASRAMFLADDPILSVIVDQMLAWASADTQALEEFFALFLDETDAFALRLDPKAPRLAGIISHVWIRFTPDGSHIRQITVAEPDGDETVIHFENVRLNHELPDGLF